MAIITNHDVGDYLYPSDNPYDIPCLLLDGQAGALAVCLWDKKRLALRLGPSREVA